ncbi:MAG TPA: NUDIX hydrolase [Ktedonobacteraceae bacterium]|nr:NUDIX hydrolase [Ktedonobacteraceae bacterium]
MDASRTMITFKPARIRFTYRVGGVLIHNGHVLCQAAPEQGFWFLPGGRAELGEAATTTLSREMQEELGITVQIERLLYIVENFFNHFRSSEHELGLYFLMTASADAYIYQSLEPFTHIDEEGTPLRFDWLPIARLEQIPLYPPCFQKALQAIPEHTVHIEERRSR